MPENDPPEESFLARWSRRKQQARGEEATAAPIQPAERPAGAATGTSAPPPAEAAAEPAPVDLSKLPRIDDLTADSDFAQFLQKGVPEELKRLALRRAWALDPRIRDFIEVAENQYNWNAPDGVPGCGPLDPGTDIAALLRQAVGAPEPAPAGGRDHTAGGSTATATNTIVEDQSHVAVHDIQASEQAPAATSSREGQRPMHEQGARAGAATEPATPARETDKMAAEVRPAADQNPPARRRHGGALPS